MAKKIVIRHLRNSTLAGKTAEFETDSVVLGRREDVQIRFDPNGDPLVSGHHARVSLEGDAAFVEDLGSSNGTFVNGQRIGGKTRLMSHDKVTLGQAGPEFVANVIDPAAAMVAATITAPSRPFAGAAPSFGPSSAGVPAPPPTAAPATGPMGTIAVPSPRTTPPPTAPPAGPLGTVVAAPQGTPRPASRISQGTAPKSHIGMNTLMGVLGNERAKERKRVLSIVGVVLFVFAILIALTIFFFPKKQEIVNNNQQSTTIVQGGNVDWKKVCDPVLPKVYCVMKKRATGVPVAMATAWSLAPGKLGTNSHVARDFFDLPQGQIMIARPMDGSGKELRIKGAVMHPGYLEFEKDARQCQPWSPNTGWFDWISPCDVGILEVADEDVAKQAEPIPLAGDDDMKQMGVQSDVCLVGYPMEGIVGGGVDIDHPIPFERAGKVTRVTDAFMGPADPDKAMILCYDVSTRGGASGSPIINKDGKVVGLHSASDNVGSNAAGVRIGIQGFSYAQHVRLMRQLLDGSAQKTTDEMSKAWKDGFAKRMKDGQSDLGRFVAGSRNAMLGRVLKDSQIDWDKLGAADPLFAKLDKCPSGQPVEHKVQITEGKTYVLVYLMDPTAKSFKVEADLGHGYEVQNDVQITEYSKEPIVVFADNYEGLLTLPAGKTLSVNLRVTAETADGKGEVAVGFFVQAVPLK